MVAIKREQVDELTVPCSVLSNFYMYKDRVTPKSYIRPQESLVFVVGPLRRSKYFTKAKGTKESCSAGRPEHLLV